MLGEGPRDLRYSLRRLRRSPLYTAIVVLTLATGIGVSVSVFSIVQGALLRPLPVRDAARVIVVWPIRPESPKDQAEYSMADYRLLRASTKAFREVSFIDLNGAFPATGWLLRQRAARKRGVGGRSIHASHRRRSNSRAWIRLDGRRVGSGTIRHDQLPVLAAGIRVGSPCHWPHAHGVRRAERDRGRAASWALTTRAARTCGRLHRTHSRDPGTGLWEHSRPVQLRRLHAPRRTRSSPTRPIRASCTGYARGACR